MSRYPARGAASLVLACLAITPSHAAFIHIEASDGDLSNSAAAPTHFGVLAPGSSTVLGFSYLDSDSVDYLSFDIGPGYVLQSVLVETLANEFAGFALFANGTATPPELESALFVPWGFGPLDLLQFDSAPGPQPAGTYSLRVTTSLIERPAPLGFSWSAEFVVSPIPVPGAAWLFAGALGLLGWARRRP